MRGDQGRGEQGDGRMEGKVCLVTGGNAGLGRATALGLARSGATVVLACRDGARGEAARREVAAATGNDAVDLLVVDLSVQRSVRDMAAAFAGKYGTLDVLINNAAVFTNRRTLTPDGLETMFATNHLGHFLLTNLLLDRLRAGAPGRVVAVTAPSTTRLDFDDLQGARRFSALTAFGASKMCNLLFTFELARRLAGTGVTANAFHPGLVKSNLMQEAPAPVRWLSRLLSASPERASEALVAFAASEEAGSSTGKFYKGRKTIEADPYARDQEVQRRLWEVSAQLTGVG